MVKRMLKWYERRKYKKLVKLIVRAVVEIKRIEQSRPLTDEEKDTISAAFGTMIGVEFNNLPLARRFSKEILDYFNKGNQ